MCLILSDLIKVRSLVVSVEAPLGLRILLFLSGTKNFGSIGPIGGCAWRAILRVSVAQEAVVWPFLFVLCVLQGFKKPNSSGSFTQ